MWNQKESGLLKDLKGQEQLCVDKYMRHAEKAHDPQLKNLFSYLAQQEAQHLRTVTEMEQGTVPQMNGGSSQGKPSFTAAYSTETREKQDDCFLCSDVLAGEKHVSGLYDTCVFEFRNNQARSVLNHIQKEEQEHGKLIYDYMLANNMYS
jgi:rubrerythrin